MDASSSSTRSLWRPRLGAIAEQGHVTFRVWAPGHRQVELVLRPELPSAARQTLTETGDGMFVGTAGDAAQGDRYGFLLDGKGPFPDPASRFQPEGVHRPSAIVDPARFPWLDAEWRGVALEDAVLYELHVGTFTETGSFAAAIERLPDLADLGVSVIELMPVADFPGARNWGYDGVCLFAPSRSYGSPDDLRRFVGEAHRLGLAVVLDVVYNHFGPDGAYASAFSPHYFSDRHRSPWGAAVNLDGAGADQVREFFIENALHWLHEYHMDGLRLDATHGLIDESPRHFVQELAERVRASLPSRHVLLFAEDDRNSATIIRPPREGGWGMDAVWADDFHHQVRRLSAGDSDGYYEDFTGTMVDLATTIREGWFFRGQWSAHQGKSRGTVTDGIPACRMVVCIQNHDQIGNRAFGQRLHHQIDPSLYRALSALFLFVPETPLLFMGQEWAASTPFLFFTDHRDELGVRVTAGRREEFSRFRAFADPELQAQIPDPQAPSTFEASRLKWEERQNTDHAGVLELYRTLLGLRRSEPGLGGGERCEAVGTSPSSLVVSRSNGSAAWLLAICVAHELVDLSPWLARRGAWETVLTTDESRFAGESPDPAPVAIDLTWTRSARFSRPGAVILRSR
jgi:maltooligosyltrehalose trehalohydrolase